MSTFDEKILNVIKSISGTGKNPLTGKWVSILGDSLSTFEGWSYDTQGVNDHYGPNSVGTTRDNNDVVKVDQTWWYKLLTSCGAKLCVNNAIGSSRVTAREGIVTDAIARVNRNELIRQVGKTYINLDGTREVATEEVIPDVVIIFMGTNDYINKVPLGRPEGGINGSNFDKLEEGTFAQGYFKMLTDINSKLNKADVYIMYPLCAGDIFFKNGDIFADDYYTVIDELARLYTMRVIPNNAMVKSNKYNNYASMDNTKIHYMKDSMNKLYEGINRFMMSC